MLFIGRYSVLCNKFNGNAWYIIDNFVNSCYLHCFIGREQKKSRFSIDELEKALNDSMN